MPESFKTKIMRWSFNLFPAYIGTGGRLTYIAEDFREVRLKLPLSWRTRNYVGTIYGGSMYAAVDPVYMIMLIKILGPDYKVWDKAATIEFKRPGRETLHATFVLAEEEINLIKSTLTQQKSVERVYMVELMNAQGEVHAKIAKTIYIAKKRESEKQK
jgi:acyl-coenzyme A thioesterase PaaI-like protein